MASYGYRSNHINDIRNNLRDRYKSGFPILKELIQNADDANASKLIFGMHPGFSAASSHPLLQGPGLWVFNDGKFEKDDEAAIRSIGLNSKAGEAGSIGKFGLGLKSVHHLCEAFFYVAFDGRRHVDVLLNPWSQLDADDVFHRAWDQDETRDYDALRTIVTEGHLDRGCKTWFLMWIPLRRWEHVRKKDGKAYGGIADKYPGSAEFNGINDLLGANLSRKIRSVIPLLRNLETIELASSPTASGFKIQIVLDEGANRVDHSSAALLSAGSVSGVGESKGKLRFLVQQIALPGQAPFSEFKKLNVWPKTEASNSDGVIETVSDTSEAEGAVMVSGAAADGEEAKLSIDWAVFLPLDEGMSYEAPLLKSMHQYRIVLHGQFFVDAGRRGIAGFGHLAETSLIPSADLDDADLHAGWNQAVAQRVVLPLLLPTLAQYAADMRDGEIEELSKAVLTATLKNTNNLNDKRFWDSFRHFVCDGQAWVRLITPDGLKWSHEKITDVSCILKLPPPPSNDLQRAWKVLPRLKTLVDSGVLLIDESASCLMRTHSDWSTSTLIDVLDGVAFEEVCSETGMSYLISFLSLEQRRYVGVNDVQHKLIGLVRQILRRESLQSLRRIRSTFKELVSLVKAEYRFALGTKDPNATTGLDDATFKILIDSDIEKLLLPLNLDPDATDASKGEPSEDETRTLLKSIDKEICRYQATENQLGSNQIENLLRAAQGVLKLIRSDKKDEPGRTIRIHKSLRILTAICARTNANMAVTFHELQIAHQAGFLFIRKAVDRGAGKYPAASSLAKLLPSEQVWVVDAVTADWVFKGESNAIPVPAAEDTTAACAALGKLGHVPVLADILVRIQFLEGTMPQSLKGAEVIRGVRYVLHGSAIHHADLDSTLWINANRTAEVWLKLKRMIAPDSWNVVDPRLTGQIRGDDKESLRVRDIGADEVIAHMKDGGNVAQIDPKYFVESERIQILNCVHDVALWKALPLHLDTVNKFGPIEETCYIDPDGLASIEVHSGVRLIALSDDSKLLQKQKDWICAWTQATTIERLLAQDVPGNYWEKILTFMTDASFENLKKIPSLRTTRWLPLSGGGSISPDDVIDLEPLADDIERLTSQCNYCYAGVLAISKEVRDHRNFANLKQMFSHGSDGLARFGQLLAEADDYLIGEIVIPDNFSSLIDSLATIKSMPAWAVVKAAIEAVGVDLISDVTEYLVKEIQKPISTVKLVEALNEISNKGNVKLNSVFNLYLSQLAQHCDDLPLALRKIRLLAEDGSWKSPSELCIGVQGVVKSCLLNGEQAKILEKYLADHFAKGLNNSINNDTSYLDHGSHAENAQQVPPVILENYFKPWREWMPPGPVGAFFALLGPKYRDLAAEWLTPYSFEYFSENLSWQDPGSRNSPVWDYKQKYSKPEALEMLDFVPVINSLNSVTVKSLLGDPISVGVDHKMIDGLVVGNITLARKLGRRAAYHLPLRKIDHSGQHDTVALANMLRKTCECILQEAYNQRMPDLTHLWDTLAKSEQLELSIAKAMILDGLHHELFKLEAVKKNQSLSDWQKSFKRLEKDSAAAKASKKPIDHIEKSITAAKEDLAKLMVTDKNVQQAVLTGIRKRVEQNQYEVSSIAFEILQNADDAVTELQLLRQGDIGERHPSDHVGRFVMETDGDLVRFMHWGRPINHMGHGKARNESYEDDLKRMLVLAASEKDETTGLTGKFGLGFKSVLLATDAPCLLSGDLAVKIVGGCLPIQWTDAHGAGDARSKHSSPEAQGLRGTVVEFVVNSFEKRSQIIDRFAALAGLQCVFSKEIRSIQINETKHEWSAKSLADRLKSVEFGEVQFSSNKGGRSPYVLNFRLADGCFALKIGARGFVRFQEDVDHTIPSIWVTAPTREPAASGLILNGPFKLDTGRGGLPHDGGAKSNMDVADRMGAEAVDLVLQATRYSRQNWESVRTELKLSKSVTEAEFWATFWEQIPAQQGEEGEASKLLNQFGQSLRIQFLRLGGEIPNGLSGAFAGFVNPAAVCLALNTRWEKLYGVLSNWPALIKQFPVSGWISASVGTQLQSVRADNSTDISEVSVEMLLNLVRDNVCSADVADTLAALFQDFSSLEEEQILRQHMADFVFEAKDDSWNFGRNLVKAGAKPDDQFFPFAPSANILHSSYQGLGLALIQQYACLQVPQADVVAGWILAAPPEPNTARIAALHCLLGSPMAQRYVRFRIFGSWIKGLEAGSPWLSGFTYQEKRQLLVMFEEEPESNDDEQYAPEPELKTGNEALVAILDWWRENRVEQLKEFDRFFWPAGVPREFNCTEKNRSSWMTLFALGLMQRHGRVQDFQNRGFIDKMQSKGVWDVFTTIDPRKNGQAWIDVLTAYGELQDEDEDYSMWMDNFPRLYRFARWYDVYTQVFLGLDYRNINETARILAPNTDSLMSGSGQYAPSVQRSLKLGQHVVTRELLRCNVIAGDAAKSLAFKPGTSVKKLFGLMGFDQIIGDDVGSHHIYSVLCDELGDDATFDGDYDIPLIIMACDYGLQRKVLGASVTSEGAADDI